MRVAVVDLGSNSTRLLIAERETSGKVQFGKFYARRALRLLPALFAFLAITTLMFIGAGPASTAGGIKVTTFAVLGFVLWSEVRGNTDMNVFRRRLPSNLIRQALTVALLAIGLVVGATLVLMSVEDLSLTPALFEVTSAFGTVGLSTGITTAIGVAGQLLLVLVMLAGRVGPVTFVTALALRERVPAYRYPEERPIIG